MTVVIDQGENDEAEESMFRALAASQALAFPHVVVASERLRQAAGLLLSRNGICRTKDFRIVGLSVRHAYPAFEYRFRRVADAVLLTIWLSGQDNKDAVVFRTMNEKYHDPLLPPRRCEFCDLTYRGPAMYCSFFCASRDA